MIHKELVEIGKKWLWSRCDMVVTELATWVSETPDVIGWKGGASTLIECKTNRQDFLRDRHKGARRMPEYAMGNYRYYLMPEKTINSIDEIPEKWGLLVIKKSSEIQIVKNPHSFSPLSNIALVKEIGMLVSCIRRIGQNPPGNMNVRAYKYKTKCRASIGVKED